MSRMFHAPLRAAIVCACVALCAAPLFAQQRRASHGNDDSEPIALTDSTPWLPAGEPETIDEALADEPTGGPLVDNSIQAQLDSLQRQIQALQAKPAEKKFPFIEVHAVSQMDNGSFGQNTTSLKEYGVIDNGADFRRSRLTANGGLTSNMNYFFQMDFSFPGRPTFTDVWMEVTKIPIFGNIRAGQWKQPFSLEVVSSFRYTTFAERSLLFNSFTPFRHIAIGFYDWLENERATWAFSAYRAGQDQFGDALSYGNNGNYAIVGRTTGLLWYECEGTQYLHVGAAYNYVAPQGLNGVGANVPFGAPAASFGTIPEYFIGQNQTVTTGTAGTSQPTSAIDGTPRTVNTGNFLVNHYNLLGTEALWVQGPLSVQSEFMYLNATRPSGLSAQFAGFYTTVGYFLTGEHRPYLKKSGAIDRIKVLRNFIKEDHDDEWGLGGWEIALRQSYVDLNSRDIVGGREYNTTIGLNWYLNSYAKVQFNYIRANVDRGAFADSNTNIYGIRGQFDF